MNGAYSALFSLTELHCITLQLLDVHLHSVYSCSPRKNSSTLSPPRIS